MSIPLTKRGILVKLLLLLVVLIPLWPSYLALKLDPLLGITLTRIFILLTFIIWVFFILTDRQFQAHVVSLMKTIQYLLFFLLIPFFAWKLATSGMSPHTTHAIFSALKDMVYYLVLFLMAASVWCQPRHLWQVVLVMVMVSIVVGFLVMTEYYLEYNFLTAFAKWSSQSDISIEAMYRDDVYRAMGPFPQPLALASFCAILLPLTVWFVWASRGGMRALGMLACGNLLISLWLSGSRGGMFIVVFMAGGCISYLLYEKSKASRGYLKIIKSMIAIPIITMMLAGVWVVGDEMATGRTEREAGSTSVRLVQLVLGAPLVLAHPVAGYGPGEAAVVLGLNAKTVDNYYLTLGLESGLPAVIMFLVILGLFLRLSWKIYKCSEFPLRELSLAMFWAIAGNIIFMTVLSLEQTIPILFLIFSMLVTLNRIRLEPTKYHIYSAKERLN